MIFANFSFILCISLKFISTSAIVPPPPPETLCIIIVELGSAYLLPFAPAVNKTTPILADNPTEYVQTSFGIICIVSYIDNPA